MAVSYTHLDVYKRQVLHTDISYLKSEYIPSQPLHIIRRATRFEQYIIEYAKFRY